jgi:hypothetical protein
MKVFSGSISWIFYCRKRSEREKGAVRSNVQTLPTKILPDTQFLMAILNSKIMDFYFRHNFAGHGDPFNKGRIEFRRIFMELTPVAPASKSKKSLIEDRVRLILAEPSGADIFLDCPRITPYEASNPSRKYDPDCLA